MTELAAQQSAVTHQPCPVVPAPVHVEPRDGEPFILRAGVRVVAGPEPAAVSTAILIAHRIGRICGFEVAVVQEDDGAPGAIVLKIVPDPVLLEVPATLDPAVLAEAYRLEIDSGRIRIAALAGAGLVRGAVTLQQLSRRTDHPSSYAYAPVVVVDHPRFAWRGLSLDLARHFFGVDALKTVINVMASLKLNVLHLHLTDDQGWRLELPSRPHLTLRSAATAVGGDPGGYLSIQDYAELITYATARHIAVVPEIDVPGHVNAALHAYGELTPSGEPAEPYTGIDVGFSRLHADLPTTAPFLRDVFDDVARLTPGRYVHIGGDEVLTMEPAEYAALVGLATDAVRGAGKQVVAWQEAAGVLTERTAPGTVVQYWDERTGADAVAAAARLGARVLLSPASKVYLDMRYDDSSPLGLDWAGHVELRDSYQWEPADLLPDVPTEQVVGVEAALWTETVRTTGDLFWLLLPRLAAVAEVAWSAASRREWDDFVPRLRRLSAQWEPQGLSWYRSPQVEW